MIDLYELIQYVTGRTVSVGESNADQEILNNIIRKYDLALRLIRDLISGAKTKDMVEASMSRNGLAAHKYLENLRDEVTFYLEETDADEG